MAETFNFDGDGEGSDVNMQYELNVDHTQFLSVAGENNMNLASDNNNINTNSNNIQRDEQSRLPKRIRDDDDENGQWHEVERRRKKLNTRTLNLDPPSQRAATPNQVATSCKNAFPKQFALAKLLKQHGITGILKVKYVNPYKLLINFENDESAMNFINNTELTKLEWKRQNTAEVGLSFGIISDIETDLSEEDLLKDIESEVDIASIKRLNRLSPDGWTASESVRIGFKGSRLPPHVFLCGLRIKVRPYIFPVTQCSRCWRFGHTAKMCPANKPICPKCGERHANCETQQFTCANCRGEHLAMSKKCPTYLKEKRIRELIREFNCTYQKALDIFVPPSPTVPETNVATIQQTVNVHDTPDDVTESQPTYRDISRKVPETNKQSKVPSGTQRQSKMNVNRPQTNAHPESSTSATRKQTAPDNVGADMSQERRENSYQENVSERSEEEIQCLSELLERLKDLLFVRSLSLQEKIYTGESSYCGTKRDMVGAR
ncbi:uncharacterized protein LOC134797005 [Cydia splendana]|uniref:uncharacterized protein LOC134797005 n=1 Tax=Cydia splendana TaxID=1100963 RepID=UPI00300DA4EA